MSYNAWSLWISSYWWQPCHPTEKCNIRCPCKLRNTSHRNGNLYVSTSCTYDKYFAWSAEGYFVFTDRTVILVRVRASSTYFFLLLRRNWCRTHHPYFSLLMVRWLLCGRIRTRVFKMEEKILFLDHFSNLVQNFENRERPLSSFGHVLTHPHEYKNIRN